MTGDQERRSRRYNVLLPLVGRVLAGKFTDLTKKCQKADCTAPVAGCSSRSAMRISPPLFLTDLTADRSEASPWLLILSDVTADNFLEKTEAGEFSILFFLIHGVIVSGKAVFLNSSLSVNGCELSDPARILPRGTPRREGPLQRAVRQPEFSAS